LRLLNLFESITRVPNFSYSFKNVIIVLTSFFNVRKNLTQWSPPSPRFILFLFFKISSFNIRFVFSLFFFQFYSSIFDLFLIGLYNLFQFYFYEVIEVSYKHFNIGLCLILWIFIFIIIKNSLEKMILNSVEFIIWVTNLTN